MTEPKQIYMIIFDDLIFKTEQNKNMQYIVRGRVFMSDVFFYPKIYMYPMKNMFCFNNILVQKHII